MRRIEYFCEHATSNYELLHNKEFPLPVKDTYYWHIVNFTNDIDKYKTILAFERAFNEWQRVFDLIPPIGKYLNIKSTSNIIEANIIISFGEIKHLIYPKLKDCPFDFDGFEGVLAHSWSVITEQPYGGQLHIDDTENWSEMHDATNKHLLTVVLHEIGHCLDLAHSKDTKAVMYAYYSGIKDTLQKDDILGVTEKFQKIKQSVYDKYYSHEEEKPKTTTCKEWFKNIFK